MNITTTPQRSLHLLYSQQEKRRKYIFLGEIEKPEHALNKTYIESLLNLK